MTDSYTLIQDLHHQIEPPSDGTLSRTVFQHDRVKVVQFAFSAGQELSEHTSSVPTIMRFIEGEANITLGREAMEARAGTWVHMPAHLSHSIRAKTPLVMLLTMLKAPQAG